MSTLQNDMIFESINESFDIRPCFNGVGNWEVFDDTGSVHDTFDTFEEEPKTLMDIPKDWEGSTITIGDCLLDLQTHINELHDYFASIDDIEEEVA